MQAVPSRSPVLPLPAGLPRAAPAGPGRGVQPGPLGPTAGLLLDPREQQRPQPAHARRHRHPLRPGLLRHGCERVWCACWSAPQMLEFSLQRCYKRILDLKQGGILLLEIGQGVDIKRSRVFLCLLALFCFVCYFRCGAL